MISSRSVNSFVSRWFSRAAAAASPWPVSRSRPAATNSSRPRRSPPRRIDADLLPAGQPFELLGAAQHGQHQLDALSRRQVTVTSQVNNLLGE